jgi:hypothetical protein
MHIGIPYADALQTPLHLAMALLSDERLDNTHPKPTKESNAISAPRNTNQSNSVKYVSTVRRHAGK